VIDLEGRRFGLAGSGIAVSSASILGRSAFRLAKISRIEFTEERDPGSSSTVILTLWSVKSRRAPWMPAPCAKRGLIDLRDPSAALTGGGRRALLHRASGSKLVRFYPERPSRAPPPGGKQPVDEDKILLDRPGPLL
jgi:hypothetical protein